MTTTTSDFDVCRCGDYRHQHGPMPYDIGDEPIMKLDSAVIAKTRRSAMKAVSASPSPGKGGGG